MDPVLAALIRLLVGLVVSIAVIIGAATVFSYGDRKMMGLIQDRLGPYHYGPHGVLQPIADTLKLLLKEDVVPAEADRLLHFLAPIIFVVPTVAAFVVLPLFDGWVTADLNIGLVYVVAVGSLAVLGILAAGWGSNNKYATLGALRSVAQVISYEVPLVLSFVPPAMIAGSLALSDVVRAQGFIWWNVVVLPLGFVIFFICGLAETNRNPFDLPEAESELTAGYLTEYSGIRWAMFFMAEYGNMVVVSAMASVLFLGGWQPSPPGWEWLGAFLMGGKVFAMMVLFLWVRATLPRLRIDQLMGFAWKVLIPLALVNIGLTGTAMVLLPDGYQIPLAVVNWALAIAFIALLPRLVQPAYKRHTGTPGVTVQVKQAAAPLADGVRR